MILQYNLQFFAKDGPGGEKTEPATEKKLRDARKEGQVAKSKEVGNAFGLLALFLVLKFYVGSMGNSFLEVFYGIYGQIPSLIKNYNGEVPVTSLRAVFNNMVLEMILIMGPVLIIGLLVAFICDVAQVKWRPTGKTLKPKLSKLNPLKGFKKIISKDSLMELVKSVLKVGLIIYVAYSYLKDKYDYIFLLYDIPLNQAILLIGELVIDLGIRVSVVYILIGVLDFAYQKHKFKEDMKMTKQEIKDEYKDQEGDPKIKGKQRQRMREASQRRMMQQLPEADVVITNPTHYAVAIKYDPDKYEAPLVIAKGEDYLAQKIKDAAKEHHIEIVENKPLARMLYANVDVGELIPPELYQAVAEVLAFVYHLKGKS
ncbi:flagellar biosynthetic protein FlhB [Kineothrix alysoides]|uniref:Flagellar biosynthetic protein FlhB n=1 Tax=Kineothrix alysoides TaxID=1469948 RepID=A0A4R1QRS5_9FIRM|nr:flagellar biosynthesis protein FlhB [Kineothrix alysoides]TCL56576.1 flagellar biosynthetic protein FlhB [Kineothrix alysoides]